MNDWHIDWTAAGVLVAAAGVLVAAASAIWMYFNERRKERSIAQEFTTESSAWVIERGLSYEELLRLLLSLDHAALEGLTDESAGNAKTKAKVFEKSQDTWSLVVFRDRLVVGYWSFFSLSPRLIKRLENGLMYDNEINVGDIRSITEEGAHTLYVEMFGVHPGFKDNERRIFKMLLVSLNELAVAMNNSDIKISAIYATGFSGKGASLCRQFGLSPVIKSDQGGIVYCTKDVSATYARLERLATGSRFMNLLGSQHGI